MSTAATSSTADIIARRDRCMTINYPRFEIAMVRGEGCRLWDAEGGAYLDLFSGFGAGVLGHCHPDLVQAVTRQAQTLWHVGNLLHTEPQTRAAEAIHRHGFGGRSFFCHSGADANEAAFKLARLYGKAHPGANGPRFRIVSASNSFHGRSFATMMATGQEKVRHGFEPLMPGFVNVPYNDLDAMAAAIDDETIGILVEPIQGEGGVNLPNEGYLAGLRKLADERDLVLIFDEVWTGCGRTGRYFAHQHWGVSPDIMTLAKGVGGGLAVGVMCAGDRVASHFDHKTYGGVAHATTLGGNCLAMAVTAAIFDVLERDGLVDRAATLGEQTMRQLRDWSKDHPVVADVRGKGLFIGIELDLSHARDRWKTSGDVVKQCLERGLLIGSAQANVLRLAPPLVVTDGELHEGLELLKSVLTG